MAKKQDGVSCSQLLPLSPAIQKKIRFSGKIRFSEFARTFLLQAISTTLLQVPQIKMVRHKKKSQFSGSGIQFFFCRKPEGNRFNQLPACLGGLVLLFVIHECGWVGSSFLYLAHIDSFWRFGSSVGGNWFFLHDCNDISSNPAPWNKVNLFIGRVILVFH